MQIYNTSQISVKDGIKCCLYGDSGVGKTTLLASAPRPFIFSAENGLLSLRKVKVDYADISTYKGLIEGYKWAMSSAEAKRYDTFELDTLSEIAEVVLGEELTKTNDPRRAYGETQQQMYSLIRKFRDMEQKHVTMVCKQMMVPSGLEKCAVPIMPSEKLQAQVPYFFDLVLHMFIGMNPSTGNTYRALHTNAAPQWQAKDRSGTLDAVEFPNLTQLFTKAAS